MRNAQPPSESMNSDKKPASMVGSLARWEHGVVTLIIGFLILFSGDPFCGLAPFGYWLLAGQHLGVACFCF